MTRYRSETEAQRQARIERQHAWAMRQYANMELNGNILRSIPAFRAIIEYDTAMLDEEDPAVIAALKTRFTQQEREDYMEALTSPTAMILRDEKQSAIQLLARFPNDLKVGPTVQQFVAVCRELGLNPFLGEIVPFQGRPYVTEAGWSRAIMQRAPHQFHGVTSDIADESDYKKRNIKDGDILAWAICKRQVSPGTPVLETKAWAIVTKAESAPRQDGAAFRPVQQDPYSHAEKRARVRAERRAFQDVLTELAGFPLAEDKDSIDGEAVEVGGELWDAETGEAREEVREGLTAEPAPETPAPVATESKADAALALQRKRFGGSNNEWEHFVRECVNDSLGLIASWAELEESQKIAVGKHLKARLDAAEKPA